MPKTEIRPAQDRLLFINEGEVTLSLPGHGWEVVECRAICSNAGPMTMIVLRPPDAPDA